MKRFVTIFFLLSSGFIFIRPEFGTCQIAARLQFHQLTGNDGLSQNFISCMLQDHLGFMWIGTKDGLNRYDGYTFKIYRNDAFNKASLSGNYITALYEDEENNLWVGSRDGGLNLFDRKNNCFIRINYLVDSSSKYRYAITAIASGPNHHLLIGDAHGIIRSFDFSLKDTDSLLKRKDSTVYVKSVITGNTLEHINSFYVDKAGMLWIGANTGLWKIDLSAARPHLTHPAQYAHTIVVPETGYNQGNVSNKVFIPDSFSLHKQIRDLAADSAGNIWMASMEGLIVYNRKQRRYYAYMDASGKIMQTRVGSLIIRYVPDRGKEIWGGLYNSEIGIAIVAPEDSTITFSNTQGKNTLSFAVNSAYQDRSGMVWLGSLGTGIYTFSTEVILFNRPHGAIANEPGNTLSQLSMRSFCETPDFGSGNTLWLGTQAGLYKMDYRTGITMQISLSSRNHVIKKRNVIFTLANDTAGNLWIGYAGGVMKYNISSQKTKWLNPFKGIKNAADWRVMKIFTGRQGRIWIATEYSLAYLLPAKDSFVHFWYRPVKNEMYKYSDPTYPVIYEDWQNKIWLGTNIGLYCLDAARGKFIAHYTHNSNDPYSLSSNWITSIVPDHDQPKKYLWLGTAGGGLNRLDLTTKKFIHFTEKDGLSNNNIYGILSDSTGRLWMSTNKGISRYDPKENKFTNFDVSNNLQNNEFNFGAFYKSPSEEMFFGGITGFNSFFPKDIHASLYNAPIYITGFHLLGNKKKNIVLPPNMSSADQVALPYNQNNFTITLSSLDFSVPEKNEYAYRIKNKSEEWIQLGTNHKITFTNLSPGEYIFQAKGTNSTGHWNPDFTQLLITISPPWWASVWAYLVYTLIILGLFLFFRRRELNRVRLQAESDKLKELDHLKSRFFANISHEFRTPLTLIIGPLEDMMNGGNEKAIKKVIPEMHRNSKRLLQLINQLLDLSRLDTGKYKINTIKEDIIPFVRQIIHSFSSMAQAKDISLETDVDPRLRNKLVNEEAAFYFDVDVVEKILTNLLSNAFKFTAREGQIIVTLGLQENEPEFMELKVEDNGEGIPADKLPYIFDRFYQTGNSESQVAGSGIGLALIKELVELHGGKISVSSEPGKGTAFSCLLPFNKKTITSKETLIGKKTVSVISEDDLAEEDILIENGNGHDKGLPLVLIVEDQQDVRKYISSHLKDQYAILEARNGKQGLQTAIENIPDLVVSDVMMSEMDGFELCKTLKTDNRTSHIPVILLTARAEDSDKMTGLETGADAYLIKPFNAKELRIRVKNLISLRNKMRAKFSNRLVVKPAEIAVTSLDREFMQKMLKTVEAHLDDAAFSVEDLGKEINMSVSQINRKLKALINQSALQFIRSARLQRAMELLKNNAGTIAEIAFKTGFETPSYFTKAFKKQFGCLPSEREKFGEGLREGPLGKGD